MAETGNSARRSLSGRQRVWIGALAAGLLVPLGVASRLEPAPRGYGTHQQLGLPPCTFWVLFDRPCPTCGMTTAWAFLARGEVIMALKAHVGGTILAALAAAGAPWLVASAARGRWLGWVPNSTTAAAVTTSIGLVTLVEWGVRLFGN